MTGWRLLRTPPARGGWNMGVDEALLRAVGAGEAPPTLRLYGWSPPCVSLGRNQRAADLETGALGPPGSGWVRRPTGGRALLHGAEVTYSVVAPLAEPRVSGAVRESYRKIAEALLAGLALLGVRAALAPRADPRTLRSNPSCFDNPSDSEALWDGRKLIGSAQARSGGALLQHGSVLLLSPAPAFFGALRFPSEAERGAARARGSARLATLREALRRAPDPEEVAGALVRGFEECWGLRFDPGGLTRAEREGAARLDAEKYSSPEWSLRK